MQKYKNALKTAASVLLILTVIFVSSCGVNTLKVQDVSVREYLSGEAQYRSTLKRGNVKAADSGSAGLYFDPENGNVSFYDNQSGDIWHSLPSFSNDFSTPLVIKVLRDNIIYELDFVNSLDNDDALTYEKTDDGIEAVYNFSCEDIKASIPVEFSLDGAFFSASVDMKKVVLSENTILLSVDFLPYLGAVRYDENNSDVKSFGDWFLVPDGPGAVMYTAIEDEATPSLTFSAYSSLQYEGIIPASVAAYAIKQSDSLLSAVVCDGEEHTLIKAVRSNGDDKNINRIYPQFVVTETSAGEGDISVGSSYDGVFSVMYEAVNTDNPDYITASVSVRQMLIHKGILRDKTEGEYPLYVSLTLSTDGRKNTAVTSYSQAENLLTILKGKGVNEINLILEGMFSGGYSQKNASGAALPGMLGGKKEFNELRNYAVSQNLKVFAGINLFSSASGADAAKTITAEDNVISYSNPLAPYVGDASYELTVTGNSRIERNVSGFIKKAERFGINGVCLLDGNVVRGDFASENSSAASTLSVYEKSLSALSVNSGIMLSSSDMYALPYADYIKDIPFYTAVAETGYYSAVPFIPALLHASVVYSGLEANLSDTPVLELLKAVEYGAVPYYHWCFSTSSDKYYETAINDAVEFYLKAKENLGDLSSKRITGHYLHSDGVYCTEYEGGTKVYVNYNNFSVVLGEVAVLPYDYLRIG